MEDGRRTIIVGKCILCIAWPIARFSGCCPGALSLSVAGTSRAIQRYSKHRSGHYQRAKAKKELAVLSGCVSPAWLVYVIADNFRSGEYDSTRDRTSNLRFRRPTPYPLGHGAEGFTSVKGASLGVLKIYEG